MKTKVIIIAIAILALVAGCAKEAQPTPTQAVTFGIASITSGDNIRLAVRQLRRLIQPAPADNEPIDIFIFNE